MSNNITNPDIPKPKKDVLDKFVERHPFIFLFALGLTFWVLMTYTVIGQKIYKTVQGYIVSPLALECDSYDGQIRVGIFIEKPIYSTDYITGLIRINDYSHNLVINPTDYNFKLKYQKDNFYAKASLIQEGGYRVSILQNEKDALLISNGGPTIPLICYKILPK